MKAAHQIRGWGNEQRIFRVNNEGKVGVSAFEDQIIADYSKQETDREKAAVYYDLLLGVVSGIQLRVNAAPFKNGDKKDGLLVLCSPVFGLFHLLAGSNPHNIQNSVLRPMRSEENCSDAHLIRDIEACFNETNGPYVLNSIGALYYAIEKLKGEVDSLRAKDERNQEKTPSPKEIIGSSLGIKKIKEMIDRVAPQDTTILVRGESGTGKELVCQAIHHSSNRAGKPLVIINCAQFPEATLESEMFGHEKGAFTDANTRRIGKFEFANGGTIVLDEVGDMPLALQAKLLRVLEKQPITRVGSNEDIHIDVRIVAATNKPLEEMVEDGTFRKDLFQN